MRLSAANAALRRTSMRMGAAAVPIAPYKSRGEIEGGFDPSMRAHSSRERSCAELRRPAGGFEPQYEARRNQRPAGALHLSADAPQIFTEPVHPLHRPSYLGPPRGGHAAKRTTPTLV